MRITLILLSIVALLFISSISWSLMKTDTPWIQSAQKQTSTPDNNGTDIETLKYQIKTEEKIKDLENKYNELARKNGLLPPNTTETKESSGNTQIEIIPVSGKFLSQVLPSMSLGLIENNGIF